jgi:pimeloyl-ACP methyl ester carboxylesterase
MQLHARPLALLTLAALTFEVQAAHYVEGNLPRQADLGFRGEARNGRIVVSGLAAGSAAARAGLHDGDELVAVDGRPFRRPYELQAALVALDGGVRTELEVRRGATTRRIAFSPPPLAFEDLAGVDSYYGVVDTTDGSRLRAIVTRPIGSSGRLPVIFFTQWVSCGSLEFSRGGLSLQYLKVLAQRSGGALIRVERSGSGDSVGPACHELDYDTEIRHYREALATTLGRYQWLDPARVVIFGSSLGGTVAPFVAQGFDVAAVMIQGSGAVTYLERMINFDRQQLERTGVPVTEIHDRMLRQAAFHVEYLVKGRSPDDIANDGPEMAAARSAIRGLGDGEHYGRPYSWHQQAARHDFLAAWDALDAPVLVVYGSFDQFETRHGHELIADTVNRHHPGLATFTEIPHMDHDGETYDTIEDAYAWRNPVSGPAETAHHLVSGPMLRWLRDVAGFPVRSDPTPPGS